MKCKDCIHYEQIWLHTHYCKAAHARIHEELIDNDNDCLIYDYINQSLEVVLDNNNYKNVKINLGDYMSSIPVEFPSWDKE